MHDIVVIGGGPAGLTAALYAARAGKHVMVLEQESPGGQIVFSPLVENYPGLPHMSGADFAQQLTAQVQALGVEIVSDEATAIRREENGFSVLGYGTAYPCSAVILATGVRHRTLGLPGEEDLVGAGISYCAVCDGAFFSGREVAVVGGGDTALQDALFLSDTCSKVTLIHRRDTFRGEEQLVRKLRQRNNVEVLLSHTVESLEQADGYLTGITVRDAATGAQKQLNVEGVFVAVGQEPRNQAFASLVPVDAYGYFPVGEDALAGVPGVFAAGDCRAKEVRQLTTAVGDGAVAALAACHYLNTI